MGRMLKNTTPKTASHAIRLPVGTSSVGPDSAVVGQTRWNTTTSKFEYYTGSAWNAVAHEGVATLTRDNFSGTGSQQDFTMSIAYSSGQESQVLVFVGTVVQIPTTNYTFSGTTTIHFLAAPSNGAAISIVHNLGSTTAA